jgi:anaerobic selenocysteine-containing dehydrogenase
LVSAVGAEPEAGPEHKPRERLSRGGDVVRAFCGLCGYHCGLLVEVKGEQPVRFIGDLTNPINQGKLCIKATAVMEVHDHPDRVDHVLKRVGKRGEGRWQQIPWEQAMDEIADKLRDIRDREGPEALATMGGTAHWRDWATWRFITRWGTPNFINQGRNCGAGTVITENAMYGWDTIDKSFVLGVTKCFIMWGANNAESDPMGWPHLRSAVKAGEIKLIVIDPRETKSAEIADLYLQIRPRTDGALALGMIRVLIEEDLYDKEFVENWCLGFDEVRAAAAEWTPERTSEITGVPADLIVAAARMYATNRPSRVSFGVSTTQIGEGAARSALLGQAILRALTGNLDVYGGDTFADEPYEMFDFLDNIGFPLLIDHPHRTRDNVSAEDVPISSVGGYARFRDAMKRVHPDGPFIAQYLLFTNPPALYQAVVAQHPYPIRAIIVQNGEPMMNLGAAKQAHEAFTSDNLELLVVMDQWQTPTAQLADYVLPAADFLERPELWVGWGFTRFFTAASRPLPPMHERRDDYDLWSALGRRLLDPDDWPEDIEEMFDRFLLPSGTRFKDWAEADTNWYMPERHYKKFEQHGFATRSGKVELVPSLLAEFGVDPSPSYTGPPYARPDVDDEDAFPLQMITGSRELALTGSTMRHARRMRKMFPEPRVDLHPDTAARYGVADGDWVFIERPEGSIRQRARLTDRIEPNTINLAGYWWDPTRPPGPDLGGVSEANANWIIPGDPALANFVGDQPLRGLRCRVRRDDAQTPAPAN